MAKVSRLNIRRLDAPKQHRISAGPVVKWVGGKSRLLPELLGRMPKAYRNYYEPFTGGGALFFRAQPNRAQLSDKNADLIAMYREVADNVDGVIRALRRHRNLHCENHYYQIRDRFNGKGRALSTTGRAAAFIYLNKTCFNGLYRVNKSGQFNVPMGRYRNPPICNAQLLKHSSRVLAKASLRVAGFSEAVNRAGDNDFVYFDPPYHPLTTTANFTSYTSGDFGETEQRQLAETARDLRRRGCHVMLSNSDTPFVRDLYHDFTLTRVMCGRAINSKASKRGAVAELIITG